MFKGIKTGLTLLKAGLARTHNAIMGNVEAAFSGASREEILENLEESLILSDIGVVTSSRIVDELRGLFAGKEPEKLKELLRSSIYRILKEAEGTLEIR